MKLKDWLTPNYQQLLIFMAGIVIGLTPLYDELFIKMLLLSMALVFLLLAKYIYKKDKEKE